MTASCGAYSCAPRDSISEEIIAGLIQPTLPLTGLSSAVLLKVLQIHSVRDVTEQPDLPADLPIFCIEFQSSTAA